MKERIITSNIILYCRHWPETVAFYRYDLSFPIAFSSHWFVEFTITESSRLSVANEAHAAIKSAFGKGITISLQVADLDGERDRLVGKGVIPTPIKDHAWNARVFYITDPEGNRIEFWQQRVKKE